jgi:hypothetical protein
MFNLLLLSYLIKRFIPLKEHEQDILDFVEGSSLALFQMPPEEEVFRRLRAS